MTWSAKDERNLRALQRLIKLRRSREYLTDWCETAGYVPAEHHRLIIAQLERLERGEIDRLMIFMPPGSAKSTYGSLLFPPWYMARHPGHSIMTCSHTMNLARRFGRRNRNTVQQHHEALGISVRQDNKSADRWQLNDTPAIGHNGGPSLDGSEQELELEAESRWTEGGEYMAAGVDTGIAGFRSDLTVIDDPVKGRKEAESEVVRQGIWDWWLFDVRPRLKPGGKVVLIMTRWHEDDLAGRILSEEGQKGVIDIHGNEGRWTVLRLPMEADSQDDPLGRPIGERLWKEWYTDSQVREAKQDDYLWLSLYQQSPSNAQGTYWKKHWFNAVEPEEVPPLSQLRIYGGSDYATKEGKGDFTVHLVVGIDPMDRPWLLDLWREQTTSDIWVDVFCDMVLDWRPMGWGEEKGQILGGVGPFLEREMRKRKANVVREQFASVADKSIMGQSMRAYIATHGLWYDRTAPWARDFVNELMAFPTGKFDDQHDALSKVGMMLDKALKGVQPKRVSPQKRSGYKTMSSGANPTSIKLG